MIPVPVAQFTSSQPQFKSPFDSLLPQGEGEKNETVAKIPKERTKPEVEKAKALAAMVQNKITPLIPNIIENATKSVVKSINRIEKMKECVDEMGGVVKECYGADGEIFGYIVLFNADDAPVRASKASKKEAKVKVPKEKKVVTDAAGNVVKHPTNAFSKFYSIKCKDIKESEEYKSAPLNEKGKKPHIMQIIKQIWDKMTEEEKKPYVDMLESDKKKYNEAKAASTQIIPKPMQIPAKTESESEEDDYEEPDY